MNTFFLSSKPIFVFRAASAGLFGALLIAPTFFGIPYTKLMRLLFYAVMLVVRNA